MWIKEKSCEDVIKNSWVDVVDNDPMSVLLKKLTSCQDNLRIRNWETFGQVRTTLVRNLKELSFAEEARLYKIDPSHMKKLHDDILVLKIREETMWKQRSHLEWLKGGDQNTRYFHCKANQRNKSNYIIGLEDEVGNWSEDEVQMSSLASTYFSNLFTTSNPYGFDEILSSIPPTVTDEMNTSLNKPLLLKKSKELSTKWHHLQLLAQMICLPFFINLSGTLSVKMWLR